MWGAVEADLHEVYGIDLDAPGMLTARSWRWLRNRVAGLLACECRITRALSDRQQQ